MSGAAHTMAYFSLFISAFLAATLLPLSSEALLATLIVKGYTPWLLWLVASVGNTLGSCLNWWLGRGVLRWQAKKWFPVSPLQLQQAQQRFQRHGSWMLLFAWVPIIGDPLTFAAGMMQIRFSVFVLLVALGKALRYALVIAISHPLA